MEQVIKVHTLTAEVLGKDGKTYSGSIAFGADSWAAKAGEAQRDELAKEAAFLVAIRHCESMGVEVDGDVEPKLISETDEEIPVEIESSE